MAEKEEGIPQIQRCPRQGDLLSLEKERVKGDPAAALYSCLKESHKDGRTKACVVAAGVAASGRGHRLPNEGFRLNMSDFPQRVVLQGSGLPRGVDRSACVEVFITRLNEAVRDLL